ncbi:hypothetical protein [Pedosphaera parvula]|uniref:Uncharacterized protein n=1 Tax=Pedosphaera parvula (strain Ellin514) TaxID=320771 RepID=B9XH23_PEDPL|nr:hypothetical protein [Pedosphaera parvula]EEF60944.1 hypothetical protein Cflav_PD4113 [Pedosphaera parvula Ellin514]
MRDHSPSRNADVGFYIIKRWQLVLLVLVGIVMGIRMGLSAEVIPPFVAEGTVTTPVYHPGNPESDHNKEADFRFAYSNGWWEVEIKYPHAKAHTPLVSDCMRIPDGVRSYILFAGNTNSKAMTGASACPMLFPAPGHWAELTAWLSFCPHPELPIIEGNRMRRFLNLPNCALDLFNDPRNEGTFAARYLEPEKAFLSELNITNNGYYIELMEDIRRYPPPYQNGFWEFRYEVLQTTNLNGHTFPTKAALKLGAILAHAESSMHTVTEINVKRISFSASDLARKNTAPEELFAFDHRPPNLEKDESKEYIVKHDQWKPVPRPEPVYPAKYFQLTNTNGFYQGLEALGGMNFCRGASNSVGNANTNLTVKYASMNNDDLQNVVRTFFIAAGLGLDANDLTSTGKSVTFYRRTGVVKVQATEQEIEIAGRALEMLQSLEK